MKLEDMNVGFCVTGSFCSLGGILDVLKRIAEKAKSVTPVFSYNVQTMDTRFGKAADFVEGFTEITGNKPIRTIAEAEVIGPKKPFDVLVIAPCTGNTLAKLCAGITDTPVLMAAKAHLRNSLPLVISLSTNDALGANLVNIGTAYNKKNIYFVPIYQDDCIKKPNSLIADNSKLEETIEAAMLGKQIQPFIPCK